MSPKPCASATRSVWARPLSRRRAISSRRKPSTFLLPTANCTASWLADAQSALHEEMGRRDAARSAQSEAEVAQAHGRERVRLAERAAQEAAFAERSCRERLAELERRREALAAQVVLQQSLLAQLSSERAAVDWTPV